MKKCGLRIMTMAVAASAAMMIPIPAHAAASPSTVTVTCSGSGSGPYSLALSASTVVLDPGDSFTLTNNAGGGLNLTLPSGSTASTSVTPLASTASTTITSTSSGSIRIQGDSASGNCRFSTVFLDVSGGSDTSTSASGPAPVVQQFGKPTSGSCDAAAPETLNWSGVASGGWGESWAEWMNSGNGGAVCSRTLVYSDSLGAWTVG